MFVNSPSVANEWKYVSVSSVLNFKRYEDPTTGITRLPLYNLDLFPDSTQFNIKKLIALIHTQIASQKNDRITIKDYTNTLYEFLKFMIHLGPYVSLGFKELES